MKTVILTIHRVLLLLFTVALILMTPPWGTWGANSSPYCVPSSCGDFHNISAPFRLKGDPKGCGDPRYELVCENNRTVLYLYHGRYYVLSLFTYTEDHYHTSANYTITYGEIRVVDDGLQKDNLSSLPLHSLSYSNFSFNDPYGCFHPSGWVSILNCSKPVVSPLYVAATGLCMKTAHNNCNLYAIVNAKASYVKDFCTVGVSVPISYDLAAVEENPLNSYDGIHNLMMDGFSLDFFHTVQRGKTVRLCSFGPHTHFGTIYLERCDYKDYYLPGDLAQLTADIWLATYTNFFVALVLFISAKFVGGAPFVLIFLVYKWRRRHLAMDANVEEFLQTNNNFLPIRYSYSDIKKITKKFEHKLGEGDYGSVYQGKLRSGIEVAIKVLKESNVDCKDFINEIASIGRIHHVNVMHLIGFCFEGSKQALVYHLMPNGSLDKHIFSAVDNTLLNYDKIYKIALGVAKGIEYLHRGCDMQILHFDIKPHNILLDENFTPKVSDFGLARLYPTDRNIVSLTTVRGTLGYMAPEFFYKDIGGISSKSDVYSFGMLLIDLAGRRKNFTTNPKRSSQAYFPQWMYEQLNKGEVVELEKVVDEEKEMIKKMMIIAFWCIQLNPNSRPSMRRVINMLEGNTHELQMPPKPFPYPTSPTLVAGDSEIHKELETFSSTPSAPLLAPTYQFEISCEIWGGNTM